jgi:polysaccharide biosynthesis protein PelF
VLFIFAWLVVGGEETEVRLLARHLDPARYQLELVACFRKPGMPDQTHQQLEALGLLVDRAPYTLSFEDTVLYLAAKLPAYDLVVACQAVPDVYPALECVSPARRPPLIEHGGLVSEALAGPKHLTARYVGVCRSIRDAAASRMPARPQHALEIPSMVDLSEFDALEPQHTRAHVRAEWGVPRDAFVAGWVGRLDRKKRVEDFLHAAALVHAQEPGARFTVIGGPDAFMPEYADELHALTRDLGLDNHVVFTGDRSDVPRQLLALDALVWLSRGEGMPHVIVEAGAASLPVIATRDNGSEQQIEHDRSGLFVPHRCPGAVAEAILGLLRDPIMSRRLGACLRTRVEHEFSAQVVARRWEALFDEVIGEAR